MNIHEYQAKQLFADAGVAVPMAPLLRASKISIMPCRPYRKGVVVKAQIHAGGREKELSRTVFRGVHVVSDAAVAKRKPRQCLECACDQADGRRRKRSGTVYFTEASDIEKEYYLAVLMDRATSKPVIIASTEVVWISKRWPRALRKKFLRFWWIRTRFAPIPGQADRIWS